MFFLANISVSTFEVIEGQNALVWAIAALLIAFFYALTLVLREFTERLGELRKNRKNQQLLWLIGFVIEAAEEGKIALGIVNKLDYAVKEVMKLARLYGLKLKPEEEEAIRLLIVSEVKKLGYGTAKKVKDAVTPSA